MKRASTSTTMDVTSPVKFGRTDKEAAVNQAMCDLKGAVSGANCSIAVAQECMTVECKERSCAAMFLGKAIGELQKASQSVETSVQNLFTTVNKQLQAKEEQIIFFKKTVCELRQTVNDLQAAAPRPTESGVEAAESKEEEMLSGDDRELLQVELPAAAEETAGQQQLE